MVYSWSNRDEIANNFSILSSAKTISNCEQIKSNGCELNCKSDSKVERGLGIIKLRQNKATLTAQFEKG